MQTHTQAVQKRTHIIFTDLDGTLLDHNTYSFAAALPCIKRLNTANIPIIPNTSKTYAELEYLCIKLGLSAPFIVENGAAVYIPQGCLPKQPNDTKKVGGYWVKQFSEPRQHWQDFVASLKEKYISQFEAFSDMSIARICEVTGLDIQSAQRAANRQYGEPILWLGEHQQRDEFMRSAQNFGASPLLGGRFLHICGDSNKGKAMQWLSEVYRQQFAPINFTTIALGDGNNDIDMLEVADIAVRISSPAHQTPTLKRTQGVYTSSAHGPLGWREIIDQLIPVT